PEKQKRNPPEVLGVLIPVSETSEEFRSSILAPLQSAYLYEESRQFFRYRSAVLVKNPELEGKYDAFRARRKNAGYSDHDLEESFGFLLFDDGSKANGLGETGMFAGNSTCTTLGDPSKGVYISMYSDCLDLNRWYHGKSGYIAIVRLTKGRVRRVVENYTQHFTEPTAGFDCHVSEQLPSVSAKTSSFLAFERTQYYVYELLDDGSGGAALSPGAACPFAIVSFSYTDTKAAPLPQEKRYFHQYLPWSGQFQIGNQFYQVDLKSTAVAVIPAKLPPVVNVDKGISLSVLRQVLPRAVFETSYAEEGLFLLLRYENKMFLKKKKNSFAQLLSEIKEKDLALTVPLIDGGYLILLHSSHFLRYDDSESTSSEALQGLFVFPNSRVVRRDTKFGWRKFAIPSETLQLIPLLSYAEGEVEKTPVEPSFELCEVLAQHMQSYATLINPGLSTSPPRPSRELSIFPDQYDVSDVHRHLYSSPEWTNRTWQSFKSYLSKPASFQLQVSRVSEILAAGQEERREDLDDEVYICLSSPEEAPASPVGMDLEDDLSDHQSPLNVEASANASNAEARVSPICVLQSIVMDNLQVGDVTKDNQNFTALTELNPTDDTKAKRLFPPHASDDLPAELIVSITSAEQRVTDETLSSGSALSTTKHGDFQFSGFSPIAKLQTADVNSVSDDTDKTKLLLDTTVVTKLRRRKRGRLRRKFYKAQKRVSKPRVETPSLQPVVAAVEVDHLNCSTNEHPKELDLPPLNKALKTRWKKFRRKRRFGKLSSKAKKLRSATVGSAAAEKYNKDGVKRSLETTISMELEDFHLRKKIERWDLKPVISECRRILVPFGSVDIADQVRSLKVKLQPTENDECLEKPDVPVSILDIVETEKESSIASQTEVTETVAADSSDSAGNLQSIATVTPEQSVLPQPVDHNDSVSSSSDLNVSSSKTNDTDNFPLLPDQGHHTETLSPVKRLAKGEYLLSRLKSVLSRRKRKADLLDSDEKIEDTCHGDEPRLKKTSVDSDTETLKCNKATTPDANSSVSEASTTLSVDPLFAYYLGWLHFQTPACYTSEKVTDNDCSRDNTVRKTVKEKMKRACSSTDALNLLADLALSVSYDQVPPQPNEALDKNPNESLKKCDLKKGLSSADQESVLHALLKTPAAKAIQPLESPSSSPPLGDSELIALISKEHNYSLPPSSCLLLGLPGTTFQVPPLSGSTGLLNHHQTVEHNRTSEYLQRHKQKFRHSRTFVIKDGSIQVTRKWQEKYDFSLDSRFTSDPKNRVIIRALHGQWDFSIQDTSKEVQLIYHMWIGLFYSRSTARFFQVDPGFMRQYLEEGEPGKRATEMVSGPSRPEHNTNSSASLSSGTDTPDPSDSEALDLSTKDSALLEPEFEVLDLSRRISVVEPVSSEPQVNRKESNEQIETPETLSGPKPYFCLWPFKYHISTMAKLEMQCYCLTVIISINVIFTFVSFLFQSCNKMETEVMSEAGTDSEVNDVSNISENEETEIPPKALYPDHTEAPSSKVETTYFSQQDGMKSISFENETVYDHVLHGCNKDPTSVEEHTENSEATEESFEQLVEIDSFNSDTDKKVSSSLEENDLVRMDKQEKLEESCEMRDDPHPEGNIDSFCDAKRTDDACANKESDIICNGYDGINGKMWSMVESIDVSPYQNSNADCCDRLEEFKDDDCLREDGLDERESCVDGEMDKDFRDQPLSEVCDVPVKEVCVSESIHQAQMHEQLPLADSTKDACSNLCANPIQLKDGNLILNTPTDFTIISKDSAAEENNETNKENRLKPVLPFSDESTCSLDDSPHPMVKDSIETEDKSKESNSNFYICNNNHEEQGIEPTEREEDTIKTTPEEPFLLRPPSSKCTVVSMCEPDKSADKMDSKADETNSVLDKNWDGIAIPFLETNTHEIHVVQPQDMVVKALKGQEAIPFINDTPGPDDVLPIDVCSPSPISDENVELFSRKMLLLDASKTNKVFDSRSSTPTMDEKPCEYVSSSGPGGRTLAHGGSEICQNVTERCSTPVTEELPFKQKPQTSTANTDPNCLHGLGPDVKLRTLRVLQSIDKYLSTTYHFAAPAQVETADVRTPPDPPNIPSRRSTPTRVGSSHVSVGASSERTSWEKPPETSSTSSRDLCPKSAGDVLASLSKTKLKEALDVKLQPNYKMSPVPSHHSESSSRKKPPVETDLQSSGSRASDVGLRDKSSLQSSLNHEIYPQSQRPVMAVKPSKSEETQAHWLSKDADVETTSQLVKNSSLLKKTTKGHFDGLNINHKTHKLPSKSPQSANPSCDAYKTDKANFALLDPPHQYKGKNTLDVDAVSSLPSTQPFDSTESYPEYMNGCQGSFDHSFDETIEHTTEQMSCEDYSEKLPVYHKDNDWSEDEHVPETQGVLLCTVFNTGQKSAYSILDQVSQRCVSDDLTKASVEQETLIFSEQMKSLLKKSKGGPVGQPDTCGSSTKSCPSPLTVNFSNLEEEEDSLAFLDMPLVRQKISVDMSDRKSPMDSTKEEKTSSSRSPRKSEPVEHAGISGMIAEYAKVYETKMRDVCSIKKTPSRHKRTHRGHSGTEPSSHFDFCGQMKKELDESFRSNLNAVVKKSCKTKYRFYILVTSNDVFFDKTKAHMEAEGHTAVQPSEFFPGEGSSSCLLIILRNEDIAEHICKIPHLLKLKVTPHVQFAGIDEPDDVVNLTHQELFTRAGLIMLDRAVLEPLGLGNMKKISEILQELSKTGKWKWMLHYRDSRRLKENARLSEEANEKKLFLCWGQDAGLLEVLPYHECDSVSKDQPDYLTCLLRLQVQHISARFPVFISGEELPDGAFEKNGILTMTLDSFLTKSSYGIFTV
uniref:Uncharacterized LOC108230070 n=1 Tax=Kryptolebias marmoratus TaxID=37003 RepID=A0A3Q2ZP21_KRYMA